jgi:cell division protein FtsW (lipid II flippase)
MILSPAPMQCVALALSILFPALLLACARVKSIRSAGIRFLLGCFVAALLFFALTMLVPGQHDASDVLSGFLLLAGAMLFWNVAWNLLAFGFTLTLLTALARSGRALTRSEWISAYTQGDDLQKFVCNRLHLLIGSGMAVINQRHIVATPLGIASARLVRLIRFFFGVR